MKEQWISIEEFSRRTGLTTNTLYSKISRTRNTDPEHSQKYKKDGKHRLINYAWFLKDKEQKEEIQKRFEKAYYKALDLFGCDYAVSKAIAAYLKISAHTANMYLRDCFFVHGMCVTGRRAEYIEALEYVSQNERSS